MPAKKKSNRKPAAKAEPKRTPKRRTALPVPAAVTTKPARRRAAAAAEPVKMRLVRPPEESTPAAVLPSAPMIELAHDMIARRAFENWSMYIRLANDPVANWLEAESQLRRELNGGI